MSISSLTEYLRSHKEAMMERWLERARGGEVPTAETLAEPQLRDHVPDLLERIFRAVAGEPTPSVETEGQEHGHQRWGTGYDIAEVVHELLLLRDVLLERVEEFASSQPGLTRAEEREAIRRILTVIDRSGQSSVARFHTDALEVRRLLWGELEAANRQLKLANERSEERRVGKGGRAAWQPDVEE